jgi:hypothetical protein
MKVAQDMFLRGNVSHFEDGDSRHPDTPPKYSRVLAGCACFINRKGSEQKVGGLMSSNPPLKVLQMSHAYVEAPNCGQTRRDTGLHPVNLFRSSL